MSTSKTSLSRKTRLLAAAASIAIAGSIGAGALATVSGPVLADAVRVQAPQAPSFADVVEKVSPAVVSVQVKAKIEPASERGGPQFGPRGWQDMPDSNPMKRFFREFGGPDQDGPRRQSRRNQEPRPVAQGSGFFISEDGYLVTNNHVVDGGSSFTVVTDDGRELDAKLIGTDPRTDLAVLKVDADGKFTYVDFADEAKVRVGDWVVAVGNPFGLGGTVTAGIVSARGRDIGAGPYDDFLQIDAAVNRGNSGGPAFDLNGQVVGVNTAIFSPSGGNVGIAFAIPASTVNQVVKQLISTGNVERGWLGVQIQPVTAEIAESLGLKSEKGALVSSAQDGSPAEKAGLTAGDIITAVDGKEVASPKELARLIAGVGPNKAVDVTIQRAGETKSVKVDLGEMPGVDKAAANQDAAPSEATTLADLGLTVTRSDDDKGLVVTDVDPDSAAAERGIQAGDVITAVNSQEVKRSSDISSALSSAEKAGRKAVLFQISRDDTNRFVALPVNQG
ncbi:Do family serine endopeptidase [Corticibacterium sp. UT-5YL-CI-8]|nr:Do family serine endopeptidase [Tianweitania sp. UT-5YL-CI-8]